MRKDLGDFQTPPLLVDQVLNVLVHHGNSWGRVLEPTCGKGNFIRGMIGHPILAPNPDLRGIEIQSTYVEQANTIDNSSLKLFHANIFDFDLKHDLDWRHSGRLLIIGNPPWVTNAALGQLSSDNLPIKQNLKALSGIEALTGASNFDIAESIWIKLLTELADQHPTIALLCKMSVARNILSYTAKLKMPIEWAEIHKIDAQKWFSASVGACLLTVQIGDHSKLNEVPIFADLQNEICEAYFRPRDATIIPVNQFGQTHETSIDGASPFEWRQGVKHDAAKVMELHYDAAGQLWNQLGEPVQVEDDFIYPLIKSTDLYHHRVQQPAKAVILTQSFIGEATDSLQKRAPRLWQYLNNHKTIFADRKSSIYRNRPSFSIFGVGDYTFAPYKVAVSGLHKTPRFAFVSPINARPVVFDDTCYFIGFTSPILAALVTTLLNQPLCLQFIATISFDDAKRPITKKVLSRIDIGKLSILINKSDLFADATTLLDQTTPSSKPTTADWETTLMQLYPQPQLL